MRCEGFYYWRGRVLPLRWDARRGYVVTVPAELLERFRADVRAGRIKQPTH